MAQFLSTNGVTKAFGGLLAVNDVTLDVQKGELVGLIGPNGSGKTTLINLITGTLRATSGDVVFKGQNITHLPTHVRTGMGIARTFQIVKPLSSMTVWENVLTAAVFGQGNTGLQDSFKRSLSWSSVRKSQSLVEETLATVRLIEKRDWVSESLTLPDRKRLELARALAMEPELLLLDEVMAGLNSKEIEEMMDLIVRINEEYGVTIICVEHVMKAIMAISKRVVVLQEGRLIADGTPSEIVRDPKVIKAYLGSRFEVKNLPAEDDVATC
ncbi:MAG: ABC transporter ATP-binding protein [Bacillota bacterium]|jgi:branched-chain amino acid transport system ATP-binding protein